MLGDLGDGSPNGLGGDRGRRESRGGARAAAATAAAVAGGGQRGNLGLQVGDQGSDLGGDGVRVGLSLGQDESDLCFLLHRLLAPGPEAESFCD